MVSKFVYYSKSADAKPGKGSGEYLNVGDDFTELSKIKNWRKTLSNFYVAPFIIDDNEWNSVEHFFHAVKFRNGKKEGKNYDYYKTFSLTGNRPWSTDPIYAKQAGKAGRISEVTGKIYDKKIGEYKIPKDVALRPDFYTNKIDKKLESLSFLAKFTQNEELKKTLLATGDAELHHYVGRGKPNLFMKNLMKVRECIRKYDNVYDLKEMSKFSTEIVTKVLNDY
jgi:predicted NAD-dependent protein-ADP-ribosyltransferase YbiA (DUF1768 family)